MFWAEDLKAGRLPHVSPISGQPSERSRRYHFRTGTTLSWVLGVIGVAFCGLLPGVIMFILLAHRASGPLFLTADELRSIRVKQAITWGLLLLGLVFFIASYALSANANAPTGLLFLLALVCVLAFVVCLLVVLPRVGPKATVREAAPGRLTVELRNIHPAFAAAVQQMYAGLPPIPSAPQIQPA